MGYFDSDAREMLDVYLLETRQLTGQLNAVLLEADEDNAFTGDQIHSIFRIMHTIKGSSAMMGLDELSSMAHKMEDLFAYYRESDGKIEHVDPRLFDLLFSVTDFIENETEAMELEEYRPEETTGLRAKIDAFMEELKNGGSVQDVEGEREEATETFDVSELFGDTHGVIVRIRFEQGCRMENVRAFMVVRQIGSLCSCVETYPGELEKSQECAGFIGEHGVFIRFVSDKRDEVLERLKKGLFVAACEILSVHEGQESPSGGAEPAAVKNESGGENAERERNEFLSVKMDRLDRLQNLTGELMIQMMALENQLDEAGMGEIREGTAHHINRLVASVERTVMEMRMVPVSRIVPRLRRVLRDICRNQGKEAELVVECEDTEADKSIVDYIFEALMHILRNAVDHGIESPEERESSGKARSGKIIFRVQSTVGELILSISDDGRGFDENLIRSRAREHGLFQKPEEEYSTQEIYEMVMQPGFTTNSGVTEYSGRGVGLDVVKKIMDDVGGHLYIKSESGKGSQFTVTVPLTLATMECIRFKVADCRFSLPARHVYYFMKYHEHTDQIRILNGKEYILYQDRMVPMIDLRKFYRLPGEIPETALLVYVRGTQKEGCVLVDSMYEQKRIVIKPVPVLFGSNIRRAAGISGCSTMGSGKICTALDTEMLIERYEREGTYGN